MVARLLVVGVLVWSACKSPTNLSPDAQGADGGAAPDGAIDALGDAPGDASADAAPDAPDPACPGPGAPTLVSGSTRSRMYAPLIASIGTTTMIAWTVGSFTFEHIAWAKLEDGVVVASGDIRGLGTTNKAQLLALGPQFVLYGGGVYSSELFTFDGAAWTRVHSLFLPNIAVSGSLLLGLQYEEFAPMRAQLFDGTTAGTSMVVSQNRFRAVAADGSGGFGVVTVDTASALHFMTYDGVAWSAETEIATVGVSPSEVSLVRIGTTWAVQWTNGGVPTVAILANGTWGTHTFTGITSTTFALAANGSMLALAGDDGFVAVRAAQTWATHQLATDALSPVPTRPQLVAYGTGFAVAYGGDRNGATTPLKVAVHDGTDWDATSTLLASTPTAGPRMIVTSGTSVAVGFGRSGATEVPHVAIYRDGAWGVAAAMPSTLPVIPAVQVAGTSVWAVYPEPGKMMIRTEGDGTWAPPAMLPATPTPGRVQGHAMARAPDGRGVVAWTQEDAEQIVLFAAGFDGASWGAPVQLDVVARHQTPSVTTNGTAFVIAWNDDGPRRVAVWTGAGITTPAQLGNFSFGFRSNRIWLASDGTRFVAAWTDGTTSSNALATYATSTDGITWSTPQAFGTVKFSLFDLAGGAAGVVALSNDASTIHARLFDGSAWSGSATMTQGAQDCTAAVGATTAIGACRGTGIQTRLWSAGAWTSLAVPPTVNQNPEGFTLATDGMAYRVDFHRVAPDANVYSTVYASGTWTPLATSAGIDDVHFSASICGGWTLAHGATVAVTSTSGAAAYPIGRETALTSPPLMTRGPSTIDASWAAPMPETFDNEVLFVTLGL